MARGFRIGYPRAVRMSGDGTSYTLAGQDSALNAGRVVIGAQGTYAVSGQDATLSSNSQSDWATRSTATGVTYAENWAGYADAAEFYNTRVYSASKNPSMGTSFTNAFEVVTTPGHVLSGKALRLYHGKNNYPASGSTQIDNQWMILLFNGTKNNPTGAYKQKVYIQVCAWVDEFFDYQWLNASLDSPNPKLFIVDHESGSATTGEVVIDNRRERGFPTCYRIRSGGSFTYIEASRSTPANGANFAWQPSIDRGAPSTITTQNQWEQRYGPCYSGMTGGSSQATPLSSQGVPDPDAAIGGVPWNIGGITVVELELDLQNDRIRYWVATHGSAPVLCGDTETDNIGTAGVGDRVKTLGTGWNAIHLSNLCFNATGASNPGYQITYTDYAELIVSDAPINFPGGYVPPGLSQLATAAASLSGNAWGTLGVSGMTQSLVEGGGTTIIAYCHNGLWDATAKRMYFYGATHGSGSSGIGSYHERLIRYIEATNTWEADADCFANGCGLGNETHGYFHFAIRQSDQRQFIRRYFSTDIYSRAPGGAASLVTPVPADGTEYASANAICWHPGLNGGAGGLVFAGQRGCCFISNAAVTSWTRIQTASGSVGDIHNFAVYNQADGLVYFGGGNGSDNLWRVNNNGTVTACASTPFNCGSNTGHGVIVSGAAGKMIAIAHTTGAVHEYDHVGNTWSGSIATRPFGSGGDGYFAIPVPEYGVICFIPMAGSTTPSSTMHLFKH